MYFVNRIHERAGLLMELPDAHHGTVDYPGQFGAINGDAAVPQTPLGLRGCKPGRIPAWFLRRIKPQNLTEMSVNRKFDRG
jgi:hypothetical protein